jgi:hypothetical protein
MAFWFGILIGGICAWYAVGVGFYETWTMLFNIIISVYLAVFLRPVIVNLPAVSDTPYTNALTMLAIAIASFAILQGITYTFLTGQFKVSFPRIFNTLGTGFLGFLAGFLIWNFVSFLIFITPISQDTFMKGFGFKEQFRQSNVSYLSGWCNLVDTVVSSRDSKMTSEEAISGLLKSTKPEARIKPAEQAEPSEPKEEVRPGPPPEADVEDM